MWSVHYIYSDQEEPDEKFFNLKKTPKKTPTKKKEIKAKPSEGIRRQLKLYRVLRNNLKFKNFKRIQLQFLHSVAFKAKDMKWSAGADRSFAEDPAQCTTLMFSLETSKDISPGMKDEQ